MLRNSVFVYFYYALWLCLWTECFVEKFDPQNAEVAKNVVHSNISKDVEKVSASLHKILSK